MKIQANSNNSGSVLVASLVFATIISVTLASSLALISDEHLTVARAQAWNAALPVAEAGVEEGLTQLYNAGVNNLSTNGWTLGTDGRYHKTRSLSTAKSYYGVAIQPATPPVIWSTGYVAVPFAPAGVYVGRLLKVTVTNMLNLGKGITAKGPVTFSGGAFMDSYTISNGTYNTSAPTADALVLTDAKGANAISLNGGGYIAGSVSTGPGSGTVATSGSGVVGDFSYITSGGSGSPNVQSGHQSTDANVQINDIATPSLEDYSIAFQTVGTTNYAGTAGTSSSYMVNSITSTSSRKPLIVNGNVTIYCTQTGNYSVKISGNGYIEIMPGASLTLYAAGDVSVSGGGVVNDNGLASSLTIYGLPTSTKFSYSGGADFIGVVDAPDADFAFTGSARAIGAFVANTVTVSGNGGVHWDSSLGSGSGGSGFAVTSWNEMRLN
jgi:Putative Ice-binding-like adhesive domain